MDCPPFILFAHYSYGTTSSFNSSPKGLLLVLFRGGGGGGDFSSLTCFAFIITYSSKTSAMLVQCPSINDTAHVELTRWVHFENFPPDRSQGDWQREVGRGGRG